MRKLQLIFSRKGKIQIQKMRKLMFVKLVLPKLMMVNRIMLLFNKFKRKMKRN